MIIVSAQSKELGFQVLGTGDWGLGLGLDNIEMSLRDGSYY